MLTTLRRFLSSCVCDRHRRSGAARMAAVHSLLSSAAPLDRPSTQLRGRIMDSLLESGPESPITYRGHFGWGWAVAAAACLAAGWGLVFMLRPPPAASAPAVAGVPIPTPPPAALRLVMSTVDKP